MSAPDLIARLKAKEQQWRKAEDANRAEQSKAFDEQYRNVLGHRCDVYHRCADELAALLRAQPEEIVATVDGRCSCEKCRARTEDIYRMVGVCINCGAKPILMLFRAGDKAADLDCPLCGNWHSVKSQRRAIDDEIPAAVLREPTPRGEPDA